MVTSLWVLLAVSVLVASFGAGWWLSLGALILAYVSWRVKTPRVSVASFAAAVALGLYWLVLIPSTTGSELVLVLLALLSGVIALKSGQRVAALRPRPPWRVTFPDAD